MNFLSQLQSDPFIAIVFLLAIIVNLSVHEFAHAWAAYKLGDDTAYRMGRVTLNPMAHLDPIGSLLFIIGGFGWGKPVEYDPRNLTHKSDPLKIALAGPISNLILAFGFNLLAYFLPSNAAHAFHIVSYVGILLASFNMIPIPPLDGSAIVAFFYPPYRSMIAGRAGMIILLVLIFFPVNGGNLLSFILEPIIQLFAQIVTIGGII